MQLRSREGIRIPLRYKLDEVELSETCLVRAPKSAEQEGRENKASDTTKMDIRRTRKYTRKPQPTYVNYNPILPPAAFPTLEWPRATVKIEISLPSTKLSVPSEEAVDDHHFLDLDLEGQRIGIESSPEFAILDAQQDSSGLGQHLKFHTLQSEPRRFSIASYSDSPRTQAAFDAHSLQVSDEENLEKMDEEDVFMMDMLDSDDEAYHNATNDQHAFRMTSATKVRWDDLQPCAQLEILDKMVDDGWDVNMALQQFGLNDEQREKVACHDDRRILMQDEAEALLEAFREEVHKTLLISEASTEIDGAGTQFDNLDRESAITMTPAVFEKKFHSLLKSDVFEYHIIDHRGLKQAQAFLKGHGLSTKYAGNWAMPSAGRSSEPSSRHGFECRNETLSAPGASADEDLPSLLTQCDRPTESGRNPFVSSLTNPATGTVSVSLKPLKRRGRPRKVDSLAGKSKTRLHAPVTSSGLSNSITVGESILPASGDFDELMADDPPLPPTEKQLREMKALHRPPPIDVQRAQASVLSPSRYRVTSSGSKVIIPSSSPSPMKTPRAVADIPYAESRGLTYSKMSPGTEKALERMKAESLKHMSKSKRVEKQGRTSALDDAREFRAIQNGQHAGAGLPSQEAERASPPRLGRPIGMRKIRNVALLSSPRTPERHTGLTPLLHQAVNLGLQPEDIPTYPTSSSVSLPVSPSPVRQGAGSDGEEQNNRRLQDGWGSENEAYPSKKQRLGMGIFKDNQPQSVWTCSSAGAAQGFRYNSPTSNNASTPKLDEGAVASFPSAHGTQTSGPEMMVWAEAGKPPVADVAIKKKRAYKKRTPVAMTAEMPGAGSGNDSRHARTCQNSTASPEASPTGPGAKEEKRQLQSPVEDVSGGHTVAFRIPVTVNAEASKYSSETVTSNPSSVSTKSSHERTGQQLHPVAIESRNALAATSITSAMFAPPILTSPAPLRSYQERPTVAPEMDDTRATATSPTKGRRRAKDGPLRASRSEDPGVHKNPMATEEAVPPLPAERCATPAAETEDAMRFNGRRSRTESTTSADDAGRGVMRRGKSWRKGLKGTWKKGSGRRGRESAGTES